MLAAIYALIINQSLKQESLTTATPDQLRKQLPAKQNYSIHPAYSLPVFIENKEEISVKKTRNNRIEPFFAGTGNKINPLQPFFSEEERAVSDKFIYPLDFYYNSPGR